MASRDPWHVKVISPRLPWGAHSPRAAEVGEALSDMMLSGEYALEDAEYQKIVPNEFVVELHEANYLRNFQPIEERLLKQWRAKMLEQLTTANSRLGRSLYQLGAPLRLEIRSATNLKPNQLRILCRVQPPYAASASADESIRSITQPSRSVKPCLEMLSDGLQWPLNSVTITIGRDESCDIHLSMTDVREKRLVSKQHAHLRFEQGGYVIYDGSPDGKASVNGTFVNRQSVPPDGRLLEDGDVIILAALDPTDPRPDIPGVVALRFREACS
jgi:hypothetical protein